MSRLLLLLPSATYRARDFLDAAARLDSEVVVASDHRQALAGALGDRALRVNLGRPQEAAQAIVELAQRASLDAVVAVDEPGVLVAALAAKRLGLAHNPPEAVAAAGDKAAMRDAFAAAGLPQPEFRLVGDEAQVAALAGEVGFPCVVKPVSLSASRGVIRADTARDAEFPLEIAGATVSSRGARGRPKVPSRVRRGGQEGAMTGPRGTTSPGRNARGGDQRCRIRRPPSAAP